MDALLATDGPHGPDRRRHPPDPCPHYARWRDGPALAWAPQRGLWVATRAEGVRRLLSTPAPREGGLDRNTVARHAARYRASVNARIPVWAP